MPEIDNLTLLAVIHEALSSVEEVSVRMDELVEKAAGRDIVVEPALLASTASQLRILSHLVKLQLEENEQLSDRLHKLLDKISRP